MNELRDTRNDTDALLAVRCQLGEPAAFDALARRWAEPLRRYVRGWTRGEAETDDLVQEIWLRVLRALPKLRDPHRLRPWLFQLARRTAMDQMRKRYRQPAFEGADLFEQVEETDRNDEPAEREALIAAMEHALDHLGMPERQTLTLFYLEDLSIAEISQIDAVPQGTIKSRLFRGRRQLRALIEETMT